MGLNLNAALDALKRVGLQIKKHAPEILVGTGIAGFVGTAVLAGKGAVETKEEKTIEKAQKRYATANKLEKAENPAYTKKEYAKDVLATTGDVTKELAKSFGPAVLAGTASATCILGGTGILKKRNAALGSLAASCTAALADYRNRVAETYGIDEELKLYHGLMDEVVGEHREKGEDGKSHKVVETKRLTTPEGKTAPAQFSPYARLFCSESSTNYQETTGENKYFLQMVQNDANRRLKKQGYLFLNDVYKMLGMEPSPEGQLVGWLSSEHECFSCESDGFVDFGLWNSCNAETRNFINEYEPVIWLDFNVDGVIWDLI